MKRHFECTYCGHTWLIDTNKARWLYSIAETTDHCPKCKDRNVKERQYETVDYYQVKATAEKKRST